MINLEDAMGMLDRFADDLNRAEKRVIASGAQVIMKGGCVVSSLARLPEVMNLIGRRLQENGFDSSEIGSIMAQLSAIRARYPDSYAFVYMRGGRLYASVSLTFPGENIVESMFPAVVSVCPWADEYVPKAPVQVPVSEISVSDFDDGNIFVAVEEENRDVFETLLAMTGHHSCYRDPEPGAYTVYSVFSDRNFIAKSVDEEGLYAANLYLAIVEAVPGQLTN